MPHVQQRSARSLLLLALALLLPGCAVYRTYGNLLRYGTDCSPEETAAQVQADAKRAPRIEGLPRRP